MIKKAALDENLISKLVDALIEQDGYVDTIEWLKRQLQFASTLPNADQLVKFNAHALEVAQSRKPAGVFER